VAAIGPIADRGTSSLLRYAPSLVLLAIAVADAGRVADTDLWGHIAFGRLFLQAGPISHDPFNYSVPGHSWAVHEWLAELLMARTYDVGGILALKLWKFCCTALTIILLAMAAAETGAAPLLQAAVLITTAVALMPMMQFRPQLYTFMFLAALLALLARENYRRDAPLWLAIPMFALWANLHGGFVIGIGSLALFAGVTAVASIAGGYSIRSAARVLGITVVCAAATLVNPYGPGAWTHVLSALHNPITRKEMVDWQPLISVIANSHGPHSGIFFFLLAVGIMLLSAIAFVITPRGDDLALVAIAIAMGAGAFDVVRNIPLAVIAAVAPLTRHLHLIAMKLCGYDSSVPSIKSGRVSWTGQAVLIAASMVLLVGNRGLLSPRIPAAMDYPVGAIAFMRAHQLQGNVFARFEWGQYVIFQLGPPSRIFVDGRVDLVYPPDVIEEYLDFFAGRPHGARILEDYRNDYVLMPSGSPADATMKSRSDWRPIYRDSVATLFAPANSTAANFPGVPIIASAPPSAFP
jgi:hypothetical protein